VYCPPCLQDGFPVFCRAEFTTQLLLLAPNEAAEATPADGQVFECDDGADFGAEPRTTRRIGRYIVADPRVYHGKLTFRGTRIFVSDVLEQVERGLPWDAIMEEWERRVSTRPSPRP